METNQLSECLFFKRNKRNKPVYTILDCGDVIALRLHDLNKEGLCIIEDVDTLTELINKRNVEKVQVNKRVVNENIKGRDWFLSPEAAYDHDNTIKLDLNILNVLL